jgi:hypothetical protein
MRESPFFLARRPLVTGVSGASGFGRCLAAPLPRDEGGGAQAEQQDH